MAARRGASLARGAPPARGGGVEMSAAAAAANAAAVAGTATCRTPGASTRNTTPRAQFFAFARRRALVVRAPFQLARGERARERGDRRGGARGVLRGGGRWLAHDNTSGGGAASAARHGAG